MKYVLTIWSATAEPVHRSLARVIPIVHPTSYVKTRTVNSLHVEATTTDREARSVKMSGAEAHREEIVDRFGHSALVAVGLSMITGKAYPFMKYVMGHGQACTRVQVNGKRKTVNKEVFTPQGAL